MISRSSKPLPSWPAESLAYIVDDDESICRSLLRLFHSTQLPARSFTSAQAYLEQAAVHTGPSCLVLDVQLPKFGGLELQKTVTERETQIVFLTGHGDVPMCAEAMKAGASDFLTKPVDGVALLVAVARALNRSAEICRAKARKTLLRAQFDQLTPREFEVMRGIVAGLLNKQIGAELGMAEKTVKIHRGRVMEKIGVASVADLVRRAQAVGVSPSATRASSGNLISCH
ncbi:MAG TPA: response regulator [Candidatus Methylacidiphilales bacterium]|nr:response regulator [Candidatus Methylacidiphilales bacterium]